MKKFTCEIIRPDWWGSLVVVVCVCPLISHWLDPFCCVQPAVAPPRWETPVGRRTERTAAAAATPTKVSPIRILKTLGTGGRLTSGAPPPWGALFKTHHRGRSEFQSRSTCWALRSTETPAAPSRARPLNPNCGPWLRSPPPRTKVKDLMTLHRVGGQDSSRPRPTRHPHPGPRSPTAPPSPDTSTTPPPSSPDTPTTAPWGPCTAAPAHI